MEWLYGIDAVAHSSALQSHGKTIAVLPSGLDNIFPKENINLFNEIIEKSGLVITEYPPKTKAKDKYFLNRNRIVSGISIGVLVIEGVYRSGTSVTAKLAKAQDKKVFAVPHEIWDSHGVGPNTLIRKGAILATSAKDVIEEFPFLEYKKLKNDSINLFTKKENNFTKKQLKNKEYETIYNLINDKPISINEIYMKSKENISKINNILFMLEVEGYIKKEAGGYICTTIDK